MLTCLDKQLQESVDVGLPDSSPAAPPGPTGSRKRARPAAEPTEDELIAGAEDAVVAAEKEVKRSTTRAERAEAKLAGVSGFAKYNAALHEYYRTQFLLQHDQLVLKDAELALSHLQWGAALEHEQRVTAICLESTNMTREGLDREARLRDELRRERAKPSPYAVLKRMREWSAADEACDSGEEERSESDCEGR